MIPGVVDRSMGIRGVTAGGVLIPSAVGSTGAVGSRIVRAATYSDPLALPASQWPHRAGGPGWKTVGEMVSAASTFPGMFTFDAVECPIASPGAEQMLIPLVRHTYRLFNGGLDRRFGQAAFRLPVGNAAGLDETGDFIEWALEKFDPGGEVRPFPMTPWVLPSTIAPSLWIGFIPEPDGVTQYELDEAHTLLALSHGFWPGSLRLAEKSLTYAGTLAYHALEGGTEGWPMLVEVPLLWQPAGRVFDPLWVANGNATVAPGTVAYFVTERERGPKEALLPAAIEEFARIEKELMATLEGQWAAAAAGYDAAVAGTEEEEEVPAPPLERSVRAMREAVGERLIYGPFMNDIANWAYSFSISKPPESLGLPDLTKAKGTLIVGFKAGPGGFFPINRQGSAAVGAQPTSESFVGHVELITSGGMRSPGTVTAGRATTGVVGS